MKFHFNLEKLFLRFRPETFFLSIQTHSIKLLYRPPLIIIWRLHKQSGFCDHTIQIIIHHFKDVKLNYPFRSREKVYFLNVLRPPKYINSLSFLLLVLLNFHTQVIYPTEKKYFASWIQLIINYQNVQFNFAEKIIRQNICWKWRSQFGGTEFVRKSFLSYLYSSMTCSAVNFKIANFKLTSTLPNRQYNYFIKVRKPIVIKQKVHIDDFPLINKWT